MLKLLELFAGTRSVGKAFERRGHQVFSVEWDKKFDNITLYDDVNNLTPESVIELCGGVPDVIWASPDCTTYSVAAISHHRRKVGNTLEPVSDYAKFCDRTNRHVLDLIRELKPKLWFIENPRGGGKKDGLYAGIAKIHRDVLPVWGRANEAYRHLDQPSRPTLQAAVQVWRTVPRSRAAWLSHRHTGLSRLGGAEQNTRRIIRPCGADMRGIYN